MVNCLEILSRETIKGMGTFGPKDLGNGELGNGRMERNNVPEEPVLGTYLH